jgi:hypothetical protein
MKAIRFILLTLLFSTVLENAFSQTWILGDSLKVEFYANNQEIRIVNTEADLEFKILLTNLSKRPVLTYTNLVFEKYSSQFGNYYWELYKKADSGYTLISRPIGSSEAGYISLDLFMELGDAKKADSALAVYDLPRASLFPNKTDTLQTNLLLSQPIFEPGDYGVQIFFRVGDLYAIRENRRESIGRGFVYSKMYYFKVTKRLTNTLNGSQP